MYCGSYNNERDLFVVRGYSVHYTTRFVWMKNNIEIRSVARPIRMFYLDNIVLYK